MAQQTLLGGDGTTGENGATHNSKANSNFTELYTNVGTAQSTADSANNAVSAHVSDANAAHGASAIAFAPYGTVAATDVQSAIQEILDEGASVPDADTSTKGIAKLYTSTGSSTDGSMDRNSITNAISAAIAGVGGSFKAPVHVATTANITLSGEQTLDGFLTSASRVLVWQQTTAANNGIYVSAAGAWSRATDSDTQAELNGMVVQVMNGTRHRNKLFGLETYNPTVGSTSLVYYPVQVYDRLTVGGTPILNNPFINEDYAGWRPATAGVTRVYSIPNGNADGTKAKLEFFGTDYAADSTNYNAYHWFIDKSGSTYTAYLMANKAGTTAWPDVIMGFSTGSVHTTSKPYIEMLQSSSIVNIYAQGGLRLKQFVNEINTQTGTTYTLVLTDWNKLLIHNHVSNNTTWTVPLNSSVAFGVGARIPWCQQGVGTITFSPVSGGVTIMSLGSLYTSNGQGSMGELVKIATDTWVLTGNGLI